LEILCASAVTLPALWLEKNLPCASAKQLCRLCPCFLACKVRSSCQIRCPVYYHEWARPVCSFAGGTATRPAADKASAFRSTGTLLGPIMHPGVVHNWQNQCRIVQPLQLSYSHCSGSEE
jgi:hypothetical protein